jgi:hypothetical protein
MVVVIGPAVPPLVSAEIFSIVPGSAAGQTKSIRLGDVYTTGASWPLTLTLLPPKDVVSPEGSATGLASAASQRPCKLARDPGLQGSFAGLAALPTDVIVGFPESTTIVTWPLEETPAEFVAVKVTSYSPCCDSVGVHVNSPVPGSKLAPPGSLPAANSGGSPPGSIAETVNAAFSLTTASTSPGRLRIGALAAVTSREFSTTV